MSKWSEVLPNKGKSRLKFAKAGMDLYQHDSPGSFRFVVKGELSDTSAQELQLAWETAKPVVEGKTVFVDVSEVTTADTAALDVLIRMRESGAHIVAAIPPQCEGLARLFDLSRVLTYT